MRGVALVGVAAACVLAAGSASASASPSPVPLGAPSLEEPTVLELVGDEYDLACSATWRRVRCTVRGALRIRNQTASAQHLALRSSLGGAETFAFENALAHRVSPLPEDGNRRVEMDIAAGATAVIRYEVATEAGGVYGYGLLLADALQASHLLLATPYTRVIDGSVTLHRRGLGFWAQAAPAAVRVSAPRGWQAEVEGAREQDVVSGATRARPRVAASARAAQADPNASTLTVVLRHARETYATNAVRLRNGGPVLGFAYAPSAREPRGVLGYEFGFGYWALGGVTLETDFTRRVLMSAMVGAGTPSILIIVPALRAMVGVPVQLAPQPAVGVRFQVGISYLPVGFDVVVDYWPALNPSTQVSLLGRVSL